MIPSSSGVVQPPCSLLTKPSLLEGRESPQNPASYSETEKKMHSPTTGKPKSSGEHDMQSETLVHLKHYAAAS